MTVDQNGHEKKYDLFNSSTGWPLAKDSAIVADPDELADFFDKLDKIRFYFVVKSDGGYEDGRTLCLLVSICPFSPLFWLAAFRPLNWGTCVQWDVRFTYNLQ